MHSEHGTGLQAVPAVTITLAHEIHAATRDLHTSLNRLITARLPRCLPPHTDSPFLYTLGLRRFAEIYYNFESVLRKQHRQHIQPKCEVKATANDVANYPVGLSDIDEADGTILYLPKLERTFRLRDDLEALSRLLEGQGRKPLCLARDMFGADAQMFASHVTQVTREKPHTLLAYTWVFYMALFNGGRWMRKQLLDVGDDFWSVDNTDSKSRHCSSDSDCLPCLSFWFFDGTEDGEDVKYDFRERFTAISETLSKEQSEDVVAEAVEIFHWCLRLVEELDIDCSPRVISCVRNPCRGHAHNQPQQQGLIACVLGYIRTLF